ncbi:MAG: hypothetical protein ACR2PL_08960 [Dehalococcoidia bacterium]
MKAVVRKHVGVAKVGLTTTDDGRWAVKVWLRKGAQPLTSDESELYQGHPIVYEPEPESIPVARPAYPGRGE